MEDKIKKYINIPKNNFVIFLFHGVINKNLFKVRNYNKKHILKKQFIKIRITNNKIILECPFCRCYLSIIKI